MDKRDPEGYRKLLAYQKAGELQIFTNEFVIHLPKTKTFFDLADQMGRSGRSGSKNIVEGWKRNTTKEYFDFLGFSIGAVEELKDDAADIITGVYPELMGLRGSMGERGIKGIPLTSLPPFHPLPSTPLVPHSQSAPSTLLIPSTPIPRTELDKLKFYPLDSNLPPVVQLFLRAKEVNFLLYKLQKSLDVKMDNDFTKPVSQRVSANMKTEKQNDIEFQKHLESIGLKRLENGQMININEEEKRE
jgi:hypothetical protein